MSEPSMNTPSEYRPDVRPDVLAEQGFQPAQDLTCSGQPILVYHGVSIPGVSDTRTGFCITCSLLLRGAMSIEMHANRVAAD